MTITHTAVITCDHPGCTASVTGTDVHATSERARHEGWRCAHRDHCPAHQEDTTHD